MKEKRQAKILEIISTADVETQEELCLLLGSAGFNVTQATVSRDIRELHLVKAAERNGKSVYRQVRGETDSSERYTGVLEKGFQSVSTAGSVLVVKTVSGMAMAVAAAFDHWDQDEIVGCIAGDDTIMVAVRNEQDAAKVMAKIREAAGG